MKIEELSGELSKDAFSVNGRVWRREVVGEEFVQWVRLLDAKNDGFEHAKLEETRSANPKLVVSLRKDAEKWVVKGTRTAGPDEVRPGFDELIGDRFATHSDSLRRASATVNRFISELSEC